MSQPVNKDHLVLFNPESANVASPTFELRGQRTFIAVGMEEGDYITFEVLKLRAGDRARYCGCILTPAQLAELEGVQELQCPACEELTQRPVRLTPQNPVVVLDAPQEMLLRAVYHGTALDARTVHVWTVVTHTKDLTDTMRGCPPIFYLEEDQTWVDTGQIRCLSDQVTVEVEQINDCGRRRWAESADPQNWIDTGQIRCLPDGLWTEEEQVNQCGHRRWVTAAAQVWTDTGAIRCLADGVTTEVEERNQCGDTRWVAGPAQVWTDTGELVCDVDGVTTEIEQTNQCGQRRWVAGPAQVWVDTGELVCDADGITTEIEQTNQCGHRRWAAGPAQVWIDTGNIRCLDDEVTIENEQTNQCGHRRWVESAEAQDWQSTGVTRCDDTNVEVQETNQCGDRRWVVSGPVEWIATGETLCVDNVVQQQETNQCGHLRWVVTDEVCGDSEHVVASLTVLPDSAPHGETFCWTLTLDSPVYGEPLHVQGQFFGTEQDAESYPYATAVIYPGQISTQFCVESGSHPDEHTLCLMLLPHARLSGIPGPVCATVTVAETELYAITAIDLEPLGPITEGEDACWRITLDRPVEDEDLVIDFSLYGDEQDIHGYAAPSLTIPVGSDDGLVCVETTDDLTDEPTRQLCLEVLANPRIISSPPGVNCVDVEDNDEPVGGDSVHTVLTVTVDPPSADEGTEFCWTITLDAPVAGSDLLVVGSLSGTEQGVHGYANPSVIIPIGDTVGIMCVDTTDDLAVEVLRTLCLTVVTGARITAVPAAVCADVLDNDEVPAASLPATAGGQCFVDTPNTAISEFYVQFLADGTMRRKTLIGVGYNTYTWLPLGGDPTDYEVQLVDASDPALNLSGPTNGAWHTLGVLRDWRWQALGPGPNGGYLGGTINIRRIGEVAPDDTMTISAATFVAVNMDCP